MSRVQLQPDAVAWEMRGAWATRKDVRLSLSERCVIRTIVGKVDHVAATGAYVQVDGWHVPTEHVLGVGKPTVHDREEYERQAEEAALQQEGMLSD